MARKRRIDTTDLPFGKPKRIEDDKHLAFIRSLPCCATLTPFVQPAHITTKGTDGGTSIKASDCYTVPLTAIEHRRQHDIGHPRYWVDKGGVERAKQLAEDLYTVTGDIEAGKKLVWEFYSETHGNL